MSAQTWWRGGGGCTVLAAFLFGAMPSTSDTARSHEFFSTLPTNLGFKLPESESLLFTILGIK